jgi:hypothetical protein
LRAGKIETFRGPSRFSSVVPAAPLQRRERAVAAEKQGSGGRSGGEPRRCWVERISSRRRRRGRRAAPPRRTAGAKPDGLRGAPEEASATTAILMIFNAKPSRISPWIQFLKLATER